MTETKHDGWLERHDEVGLDELFIDAPVSSVHVERMDAGAWWMRADLLDGRAVVLNLYAKRQGTTDVSGHVEEEPKP